MTKMSAMQEPADLSFQAQLPSWLVAQQTSNIVYPLLPPPPRLQLVSVEGVVDKEGLMDRLDERFYCHMCGKGYPSASALLSHDRVHSDRPHECDVCTKTFATSSHLATHKRIHTGERPYQCQICKRSFADRSAFVKHVRTHGPDGSSSMRCKCEVCGDTFVDACGLKKHLRRHTGERPYQCNVCGKTFSTSSTFAAHRRIHTGERPHKCALCSKMFVTKSHLLTHLRVHTGEKPFSCPICGRSFADGSSFRRHERLHTVSNEKQIKVDEATATGTSQPTRRPHFITELPSEPTKKICQTLDNMCMLCEETALIFK